MRRSKVHGCINSLFLTDYSFRLLMCQPLMKGCIFITQPANILLDEHGHVRISDLGLACDFSKKKPHASVWVLFPFFFAFLRFFKLCWCLRASLVQGHPWLHGTWSALQRHSLRFQCRLVLARLHAVQAAQGVSHCAVHPELTKMQPAYSILRAYTGHRHIFTVNFMDGSKLHCSRLHAQLALGSFVGLELMNGETSAL